MVSAPNAEPLAPTKPARGIQYKLNAANRIRLVSDARSTGVSFLSAMNFKGRNVLTVYGIRFLDMFFS